jgi:hypothetical protein
MKTTLIISIFFLFRFTSNSQIIGIDYSKAKPFLEGTNEELVYQIINGKKTLMITFATTPVGLKHCIEKAKEIVELNGLNFDKPNVKKDELFADFVEGITDYSNLSLSLSTGGSEVTRMWKMASNDGFVLSLTEKIYGIVILPVPK